MRPDIVVYSKDGKIQLVIEIKKKSGVTPEWAANTRRNLLVHAVIQPSPFFLLVSSDYLYLWKNAISVEAEPPDYEANTNDVLSQYTEQSNLNLGDISEYSLEMLVTSWLNDLTRLEPTRKINGTKFDWVYKSGLYEAIKDGSVMTEVVQ